MQRFAWFKWQALFHDWHLFGQGLVKTVSTSALALVVALALGILFGIMATAPWRGTRLISRAYVDVIQNTPLFTQVMFFFYALGHWKIYPTPLWIGVIGLGTYHGAYVAEVVRAGIQSIHRGQMEAALSQGFTYSGAMRHVVLPQAIQVILPPLTNQAVALIKNSAILATISGYDLMHMADSWSAEKGYYGPAYLAVWVVYFLLCFPLATYARKLEARVARERGGEVKAA
ncbi:MAG TPA: amino acid ABC transporter permease [Symbiobacteriaceae bacterium]